MSIIKFWRDLNDSERNQVILVSVITMFFSMVVLYGFLVSRGHDVDYFRDRMTLMEQRLNYIDQKLDKTNETLGEIKREIVELKRMQDQQQRELEDHRKWVEHWKSLPQLPKPPQKR